jgi:glycosyltransferase involved in cell wall biosynthesis
VRVALVTHQFFPAFYTGVERLTLNLAAQLRRMGHECVVVTSAGHSGGGADAYAYDGTRVRTVETLTADLARPWVDASDLAARLARVLDDEGVEVVHVMHPMRLAQVFDAADLLGLPVVAHIADFAYLCARVTMIRVDGSLCTAARGGRNCVEACGISAGGERFDWAQGVLSRAAAVVSPCRFTIGVFAAEGFDTRSWQHVPWGVDYSLHPARPAAGDRGDLTVGFLGTLLAHKGARVLVEAVRLLEGRRIALELYGESFHEEGYERELRRLAAGDARIAFRGSYTHGELPRILASLDAVAIPSLWHENLPTTGLNAVAAGVPLLVSGVGGLTELLDDYDCGFAFPAGDAGALAALLEQLVDDRGQLEDVRRRILFPPSLEEEAWRLAGIYAEVAGSG